MTKKPNIVFITCHDAGRHFGCYGVPTVQTPHIDALAAAGVQFDNFFCVTPVCSPSRGAMLSGLHPQTNGMLGLVHPPNNWEYAKREYHLSHLLRDRGYYTSLFFHQHETMDQSRLAFDDFFIQDVQGAQENVGKEFTRFVTEDAPKLSKPFYAQIGFGLVHRQWDSDGTQPDDSLGVFVPPHLVDNEAAREDLKYLQGACKRLDDCIGLIINGLKQSGLEDDTIVIFTVDHGVEVPRAKWHLYDPGIEVAYVMRYPNGGIAGGKKCTGLLSNVDVTPTLFELIGEDVPEYMQGESFAADAINPEASQGRAAIYGMMTMQTRTDRGNDQRCVRTNDFKFIRTFSNHTLKQVPVDVSIQANDNDNCPTVELYDLKSDPLEFVNVAEDPAYRSIRDELDSLLWRHLERVSDPILSGPIRVPLYQSSLSDYHKWKH